MVRSTRGRGPSLRAFLLLAALQIARFLCCMIASLMACCAIHIILPRCCKQWLQCERFLHWWVVIWLGLLLHAQLELSLHHLLPYWLSANSHVSWRRVLRTPPHFPFLGRGVPQVKAHRSFQLLTSPPCKNDTYGAILKMNRLSLALLVL